MERLQKVIANAGVCSRRKAEELIVQNKVRVNDQIISELGYKVSKKDSIYVNDEKINIDEKEYYLLNKPRGVVTTTKDDKNRTTVVDLIQTDKRIYPVGRLDYDTTGALILTNDGDFANMLMHPSSNIEKVYIAKVKGIAKAEHIIPLRKGVIIEGARVVPDHVKLRKADKKTNSSTIELVIHEGKNHQVKKMLLAVGLEVVKLKRERISFLNVEGLESGEFRKLSNKEISKLYVQIKK